MIYDILSPPNDSGGYKAAPASTVPGVSAQLIGICGSIFKSWLLVFIPAVRMAWIYAVRPIILFVP